MICPKCNSDIDDNSFFCPVCGLDIVEYDEKKQDFVAEHQPEDATSKIDSISTFTQFADLYNSKYVYLFNIFEPLRIRKLLQTYLFKFLFFPLFAILSVGAWYFVPITENTVPFIYISLFFFIISIALIFSLNTFQYFENFKEPYEKFLYECFGIKHIFPYKWKKMFSILKKSDLFSEFNTINTFKSYGFLYKNYEIHIEDMNLVYDFMGKKEKIFNGIIIIMENKDTTKEINTEIFNTQDSYNNILNPFEYAYKATKSVEIAALDNKIVVAISTDKKFLNIMDLRYSLYNPQYFENTYNQIFSIIKLTRFLEDKSYYVK